MRIFLTHILPEHLVAEYHLSFAACNFSRNLMSGGGFDKVYSIMPLFVCGEMKTFKEPDNELVYSSLRRKGGGKISNIRRAGVRFFTDRVA